MCASLESGAALQGGVQFTSQDFNLEGWSWRVRAHYSDGRLRPVESRASIQRYQALAHSSQFWRDLQSLDACGYTRTLHHLVCPCSSTVRAADS